MRTCEAASLLALRAGRHGLQAARQPCTAPCIAGDHRWHAPTPACAAAEHGIPADVLEQGQGGNLHAVLEFLRTMLPWHNPGQAPEYDAAGQPAEGRAPGGPQLAALEREVQAEMLRVQEQLLASDEEVVEEA